MSTAGPRPDSHARVRTCRRRLFGVSGAAARVRKPPQVNPILRAAGGSTYARPKKAGTSGIPSLRTTPLAVTILGFARRCSGRNRLSYGIELRTKLLKLLDSRRLCACRRPAERHDVGASSPSAGLKWLKSWIGALYDFQAQLDNLRLLGRDFMVNSPSAVLGCGGRRTWLVPSSLERIQSRASAGASCDAAALTHTIVCLASFSAAARPTTCFASSSSPKSSGPSCAPGGHLPVTAHTWDSGFPFPPRGRVTWDMAL